MPWSEESLRKLRSAVRQLQEELERRESKRWRENLQHWEAEREAEWAERGRLPLERQERLKQWRDQLARWRQGQKRLWERLERRQLEWEGGLSPEELGRDLIRQQTHLERRLGDLPLQIGSERWE